MLRSILSALWVPVVLLVLNVGVFLPHYAGKATFPWDFIGGYHSMAYAWYRDGGFFSPPYWSPYTHFGYPTHLALQNSSFYLPLAFLDWLKIPYTIEVATVLQCLHVWIGALGVFYFLRRRGIIILSALLGAIAYHFSSGFFSNAQHVDIIRGYAWLPWLLFAVSRSVLQGSGRWRIVASSWIIVLFLTGSYPGLIIASFYMVGYFILTELVGFSRRQNLDYLARLGCILLLAVLLSSLKFLPLTSLLSEIQLFTDVAISNDVAVSKIRWINLLTLFFRSDLTLFVPSNITARSLFITPIVLFLPFYVRTLSRNVWVGLSIAFLSLAFAFDWSETTMIDMPFPGMKQSRFPLLDYRPMLHVGLILLACESLQQLCNPLPRIRCSAGYCSRLGVTIFVISGVTGITLYLDYPWIQIRTEVMFMLISTALIFIIPLRESIRLRLVTTVSDYSQLFKLVSALILVFVSSLGPLQTLSATWNFSTYRQYLESIYHIPYFNLYISSHDIRTAKRGPRSPNSVLLTYPTGDPTEQNLPTYLKQFGTQGYDNGSRLKRRIKMVAMKSDPNLMKFMMRESQVVMVESYASEFVQKDQFNACLINLFCISNDLGLSSMDLFSSDLAQYHLNIKRPILMVENELYYPGWSASLCPEKSKADKISQAACQKLTAKPWGEYSLRSWVISEGEYVLTTTYKPPLMDFAWILFTIGGILSLVLLIADTLS